MSVMSSFSYFTFIVFVICSSILHAGVKSFPDQGKGSKSFFTTNSVYFGAHKSLYSGSTVSATVTCEPSNPTTKTEVEIGWILQQTSCFEDYLGSDIYAQEVLKIYYTCPMNTNGFSEVRYLRSKPFVTECTSRIQLTFEDLHFLTAEEDKEMASRNDCRSKLLFQESTPDVATKLEPVLKNKGHPTALPIVKSRKKRDSAILPKISSNSSTKSSTKTKTEIAVQSAKDHSAHKNTSVPTIDFNKNNFNTKHGTKLVVVKDDGIYLFVMSIRSPKMELFNVTVEVTMKGNYGYLSAADFPFLLFYGFMCAVYVVFAFGWLTVSALQWRDLLRIQFWIGAVIFLGLLEKAVFYAEYQSINYTGQSVKGAVLFAEVLSCMKRTLARMLVIIVSVGFGIVKPRLGTTLHRVVAVGMVYFILGVIEGSLRVLKPKNDPSNQALMAGIPLAVTDSIICWWIFSSLSKTTRTLRLRRNVVKLSLYRNFITTLIVAVLASVVYMVWSIHSHKLVTCISDWKELWLDEAFWHLLFSLVLLVIMILWRPTNNNQRYAFTPLLDAIDDDNEDDFDSNMANDAFVTEGMKMRSCKPGSSPKQNDMQAKTDDDLKWVEENIPTSLSEAALPSFMDPDDEIMTVKFERNKME